MKQNKRLSRTRRRRGKQLGRNMRQMTVYLYVDQLDALQRISKRDMVPMSALIRYGIDKAIDWAEVRNKKLEDDPEAR